MAPNDVVDVAEKVLYWFKSQESTTTPTETSTNTTLDKSTVDDEDAQYETADEEDQLLPVPPPERLWLPEPELTPYQRLQADLDTHYNWNRGCYKYLSGQPVSSASDDNSHDPTNDDYKDIGVTYSEQGVQTSSTSVVSGLRDPVSRGVQTHLVAFRTGEDINELTRDLPEDFWETLDSILAETDSHSSSANDDHRSPELH